KTDRRRNEWATKLLVEADSALRPEVLARLLNHAADKQKRPMHRARILRVLEMMGSEVFYLGRMMLFRMTYDESPTVRRAAAKVLKRLMVLASHGSKDDYGYRKG